MAQARKLPRIVRKRSKLHGFGVFAAEAITKNTRIIDYAGELIRNSRSGVREARYLAKGASGSFASTAPGAVMRPSMATSRASSTTRAAELLVRGRRQDDLDSSVALDSRRRGADLRLPDERRPDDPLPLPARVQDETLIVQRVVTERGSRVQRDADYADHGLTGRGLRGLRVDGTRIARINDLDPIGLNSSRRKKILAIRVIRVPLTK